jgi:hypothetical protein
MVIGWVFMESGLLQELANKSITKEELYQKVEKDFQLLPEVLSGVSSSKAAVKYGCAKVLMDLSAEHPEKLYPHMDSFTVLLGSKHRILVWDALAIIANLCVVDTGKKFDAVFGRYFGFLNDAYMVTVANVVGNSGKIALAKPHLIQKITGELLKVEEISTTPHLTEECKGVIAEKAIGSFNLFFDRLKAEDKARVVSFVKRQVNSSRKTLQTSAEDFLKRWNKM